jgi:hypothetical protein
MFSDFLYSTMSCLKMKAELPDKSKTCIKHKKHIYYGTQLMVFFCCPRCITCMFVYSAAKPRIGIPGYCMR